MILLFYKYNDIKIYVDKIDRGKNKNIIILPGWGNTINTFFFISNYFKDYNVYIVNYPGFGKSPKPNKDLTIYDYSDLVKNFIKKYNINNIYLIAHSFGGRIASILVGKDKLDVKKLVLMDTAGIRDKKMIIKNIIYKIRKKFTFNKEKLYSKYASSDYKILDSVSCKTFSNIVNEDLTKYYRKIKVETLIIWGLQDDITPIKFGRKLKKIVKYSTLIEYKFGKHFTYLEYYYNINNVIDIYFNYK